MYYTTQPVFVVKIKYIASSLEKVTRSCYLVLRPQWDKIAAGKHPSELGYDAERWWAILSTHRAIVVNDRRNVPDTEKASDDDNDDCTDF